MRHITYHPDGPWPIALLIKDKAFNANEIEGNYTYYLEKRGIDRKDLVAIDLPYNEAGKVPVKFIKEQLENIVAALDDAGVTTVYCADANYFKVMTGSRKAEPHLGYVLPCKIPGYEYLQVILGVNHKSLAYDPKNEPKLMLSLDTLAHHVKGGTGILGADIIHFAEYPGTLEEIAVWLQRLKEYPQLACDIEGFSLDFEKAGIATITFAWSEHEGIAFTCDYRSYGDDFIGPVPNGHYGQYVPNEAVRALLREFFETYEGTLVYHNATYDMEAIICQLWMKDLLDTNGMLQGLDILSDRFHDTKIIAYLATNSCAGNDLKLKNLAHEHAGNWAQDDIKDIRKIPLQDLLQYNLVDGLATNYVFRKYYPRMVEDQQEELYYSLMLPSQKTIMQMEMTGLPLCPNQVQKARKELEGITQNQLSIFLASPEVKRTEDISTQRKWEKDFEDRKAKAKNPDKIMPKPRDTFPRVTYNPNSGPQTITLLYEVMGLPVIDTTDTGLPAVGGDTLEKLINHTNNPGYKAVLQALIDFLAADKILGTFISAFEKAISKGQEVVWLHGNFNLGGTKSGRLSSSDPNLQNLPAGSTYGKLIKKCVRAPKGWIFCGADFNSLEDYISALTTKDPNKLKVYTQGYDGHCLRAFYYFPDRLPGIEDTVASINSIKKKFPEVRQDSKAPTFALTYQGTSHTLMNNLGFPKELALQIEANYHEMYKVSDEWVQLKLDQAAQDGFVTVAFGLRLRTPVMARSLRNHRSTPYQAAAEGRTAGNALGQSYGLLTNRSMNAFMDKVWSSEYRFDVLPVAMIHDANYFLIRDDVRVVEWTNTHLIKEMQWQELPEIQHDTVKLGAELSLFYPSWADEIVLPNGVDKDQIRELTYQHLTDLKEVA